MLAEQLLVMKLLVMLLVMKLEMLLDVELVERMEIEKDGL
jgi:hypothetical protein